MNANAYSVYRQVTRFFILLGIFVHGKAFAQVDSSKSMPAILKTISSVKTDSARAEFYRQLAWEATNTNYVKAGEYSLKAVEYGEKSQSPKVMYQVYIDAGEIFLNAGNEEIAAEMFTRYVDLARSMGDSTTLVAGYFNLGTVWLAMNEYDKAGKMMLNMAVVYEDYLRKYGEAVDTANLLSIYNNLIIIKSEKGLWEEGRNYFEKGVQLAADQENFLSLLGMLHINYGDLLLKKGDNRQAIELYQAARALFVRADDKARVAIAEACLGDAYEKAGDAGRAIDVYRQVFLASQLLQNEYLGQTASEALYRLYKGTALKDSTLRYLTLSNEYDKKIRASQAREKLISKELSWKFEEMQREQESSYKAIITKIIVGLVLLSLLVFGLMVLAGKKHQRLKQVNLEKYQLALDAQKLQLDKELLVAQVELKDKQLATEVLHRVQNHELIKEVVQKLIAVHAKSTKETKETLSSVLKGLEKSLEDKAWDDFELRFQQVHPNFYERLQRDFQDLSLNERRLCAFLKLNMTTKEISAITGQSINSIQVARWRLRKKLHLQDADAALTDFFTKY